MVSTTSLGMWTCIRSCVCQLRFVIHSMVSCMRSYRKPTSYRVHGNPGGGAEQQMMRNEKNENLLVTTTKAKLFHISQQDGKLSEKWTFYATPRLLKNGDPHPYAGEINIVAGEVNPTAFRDDSEADDHNYYLDGVWGQRTLVDLKRRQVIFPGGNVKSLPKEDILIG